MQLVSQQTKLQASAPTSWRFLFCPTSRNSGPAHWCVALSPGLGQRAPHFSEESFSAAVAGVKLTESLPERF